MKKTKISKPLKSVKTKARVTETPVTPVVEPVKPMFVGALPQLPKISPVTYVLGGMVIVAVLVAVFFKSLFVVAMVNGKPISRLELIGELERLAGKQALNSLVTRVLIEQEAAKKKVAVTQKETDEAVAKLTDDLKKQGQDINKLLTAQGMTMSSLQEQLRVQKLVEKIFEKDLKVTDKEVTDYIEKNKEQLPENQDEASLKESVMQQLKQQKLSDLFQGWLQTAQKNAKITYYLNF